jgi:hypothetical protein
MRSLVLSCIQCWLALVQIFKATLTAILASTVIGLVLFQGGLVDPAAALSVRRNLAMLRCCSYDEDLTGPMNQWNKLLEFQYSGNEHT